MFYSNLFKRETLNNACFLFFKDLSKVELGAYAQTVRHNEDIVNTLYELFEKYPDHDVI